MLNPTPPILIIELDCYPEHCAGFCQLIIHAGVDNSTHLATQARGREALDSVSLIVKAFVEHSGRMSLYETDGPEYRQGERGLLGYESV